MVKTKIVNNETLEISSQYHGEPNQSAYGGPWGKPDQFTHIAVPEGIDEHCVKAQLNEDDEIELVEDADLVAAKLQGGRDIKLRKLREIRDAKLDDADNHIKKHEDSDPSAVATAAEWKSHRVALRDITDSYRLSSVKENENYSKGTDLLDSYESDMSDFDGWPEDPS